MTRSTILRTALVLTLSIFSLLTSGIEASAQRRASSRRGTSTSTAPATSASNGAGYGGHASSVRATSFGGSLGTTYSMFEFGGQSMSGIGFNVAAVADIPVAPSMGVIVRAGYESKSVSKTYTEKDVSVGIGATLNYIELGGAIRYDVSRDVLVEGGMALQLGTGGVATIDGDLGSGTLRSGELSTPTQVALTAGMGYRMQVSPNMEIIPTASFNLFLTSPTPDGSASGNTIRVGARVMFD